MDSNRIAEPINRPLRSADTDRRVGSAPTPDVVPVGMRHHTTEELDHDPGACFLTVGDTEFGPFRTEALALASIALAEAEAASRLLEEWSDLDHLRDAVRDPEDEACREARDEAHREAVAQAKNDTRWARRGDDQ